MRCNTTYYFLADIETLNQYRLNAYGCTAYSILTK